MVWQRIIFGLLLLICVNRVIAEVITPQVTGEGVDVSMPEIALYSFARVFTDLESSLRPEVLKQKKLHKFIDQMQLGLSKINDNIYETYF